LDDLQTVTDESNGPALKPEEVTVYVVDGFMVMFTALSMILLAFFILLNSLAVQDERKQRAAIGSLLGSFGVMPDGVGFDQTGSYVAKVEYISLSEEMTMFAAFEAFLDDEWKASDVDTYIDEEGRRRIRFTNTFMFESNSVRLHPRVFPLLDRLAAILKELDRPVEVEGHTDIARGRTSNWKLSARRAASVVRYMEEGTGLMASRLTAVGFGASRPFTSDSDARNRRVEIVVN